MRSSSWTPTKQPGPLQKCSDRNRSLRSSCNAQPLRRWSRNLASADHLFQQLCQGDLSRGQIIVAYRCLHNLCQGHWAVEPMPPLNSIKMDTLFITRPLKMSLKKTPPSSDLLRMPLLIGCSGINCKWANAVQNRMEVCLIPPDFTPNPLSFEEFSQGSGSSP